MSDDLFSVIAALSLIAFAYRYFSSSPRPSPSSAGGAVPSALQRRAAAVPRSQVDRVIGMFPQVTEQEVRYALVTMRGGVEAVAERILTRGGLEPPPLGFFPASPAPSTPAPSSTSPSSTSSKPQIVVPPSTHITRLSLTSQKSVQDRAIAAGEAWSIASSAGTTGGKALGEDLKDRKERMVLEARWSLLQKERKGKSPATQVD